MKVWKVEKALKVRRALKVVLVQLGLQALMALPQVLVPLVGMCPEGLVSDDYILLDKR